jgi:hypothetical protein
MRKTFVPILLAGLALAACKKNTDVKPAGTVKIALDTIPDNARFKIRLAKDSVNRDETLILFDHTTCTDYRPAFDAPYFPGFGKVSLCSVSGDGKNMAIYTLPYKTGMSINLNVNAKTDGDYSLALSSETQMPKGLHIWIRDAFLKDSADVCSGSYSFKVVKADNGSFGGKRFSLVFKQVTAR